MNCNIEKQVVFCCICCRKIQRLCKARAEAKFTWIMPSRRQFSCKRVQSRTCSGYAERSRKCQEIFVQASAEPNLFGLCRAQPKMSRKGAFI